MVSGISLANKIQLLFGFAVVLILAAALTVPWIRTEAMVREHETEVARQLAEAWLRDRIELGGVGRTSLPPRSEDPGENAVRLTAVMLDDVEPLEREDSFLAAAVRRFREDPEEREFVASQEIDGNTVSHYARAIREADMRRIQHWRFTEFDPGTIDPQIANRLRGVLLIDRRSDFAIGQLLLNRVYIVAAGLFASLLAVLVFYLILTKVIFSPVRKLRETAEKVNAGDLSMRAEIRTGDEFEQLSKAFNNMLERVALSQNQLRSINESLDLKLSELAEANIGLYESNRLKGEFLANVSHELRTPLNSIIGFTELLDEIARSDEDADPKRRRYLGNILSSARALLEMINDLLEMAKIEAGRMEVNVESISVSDLVEGLVAVMRPQAVTKEIEVVATVEPDLPVIETDPGKLQQILYNFLSNAIKFTPNGGSVTITAERARAGADQQRVRLGVTDSGPGIPLDMQDTIFEKFRQVDASHTRQHQGVGLGLAICRELAEMLGARIWLKSVPGHGASFFVDLPQVFQTKEPQPLMA